jgi:hypothetical protein
MWIFTITSGFRTTFKVAGGYWKAATSFRKMVLGRIFKFRKGFNRSKQQLYFGCSSHKNSQNVIKTIRAHTNNTVMNFRTFKKTNFLLILSL